MSQICIVDIVSTDITILTINFFKVSVLEIEELVEA